MKQALLLLLTFVLLSCNEQATSFKKIECSPSDSITNTNLRNVFEPCKEFIYSAKYWDAEYNLISHEQIWVMATGQGWEYQPDSQDEILIQYSHDPSLIDSISRFSINPEIQHWRSQESTGIIETGSRTWMHPFRSNQYLFTEVAPFPSVQFPLEQGKTWTSSLNIYEGWGVWANSTLDNTYEVVGYENIATEFGELEAWHVSSVTTAEFGTSSHNFWYNMELGFVKMIIKNYAGQLLQFELAEVKEAM
ncbi:MAG: hypothetical protein ACI82Q_002396 [Nonlabens sp.]|jgi:hypothetical protein